MTGKPMHARSSLAALLVALAGAMSGPGEAASATGKTLRTAVVADRDVACALDEECGATSRPLPEVGTPGSAAGLSVRVVEVSNRSATGRVRRLFLYRLDPGPESRTDRGCVDSISFDTGPLAGGLDLDGDGRRGERAVVIDSETEVAPSRVVRTGRVARFEFSPALCPGGGALHDGRSTEFGWMSYRSPGLIHSDLSGKDGSFSLPIWGPKRNPKNVLLDKIKLDVQSRIPEGCGPTPVEDPELLDCWLDAHPEIKADLTWRKEDSDGWILPWSAWPEDRKADVRAAFAASWAWAEGGFQSYGGPTIGEPPTNVAPFVDGAIRTVVTEGDGWAFYAAHLGHSLAAEIFAWVPWSITHLDPLVRHNLLGVSGLMGWDPALSGYAFTSSRSTPAHPVTVWEFLRGSNLIGPTQTDTVARLLDWSRDHMKHSSGQFNVINVDAHWGYPGPPPASLVIEGTIRSATADYPADSEPVHWTAGCSGTTDFLRSILRAVNIPVVRVSEPCGHTVPYFPSLKAYLSHGDDPYDQYAKGDPTFPAKDFLVAEATWFDWFLADPLQSCANVGRRPAELSVFWLTNGLMSSYCADELAGLDHASGSVAKKLAPAYDLAELEAMDLWTELAAAAQDSTVYPCDNLP